MSILEAATAALRETPPADGARTDATRARLARSLEGRARRHRHVGALVTVLVLMLGATASWAWSTGRLQGLFGSGAVPRDEAAAAPVERTALRPETRPASVEQKGPPSEAWRAPVEQKGPPSEAWRAPVEQKAPPSEARGAPVEQKEPPLERAQPQPETWTAPVDVVVPAVAKRAPVARPVRPADVLYRRAHELHFRGTDREAALAAWDAYLAAGSTGTFAIEARFNRGIVLVRLARYAEAIAALAPFARGEVANGYRHEEAAELVTRLRALTDQR